jgi:hypothetical protein
MQASSYCYCDVRHFLRLLGPVRIPFSPLSSAERVKLDLACLLRKNVQQLLPIPELGWGVESIRKPP